MLRKLLALGSLALAARGEGLSFVSCPLPPACVAETCAAGEPPSETIVFVHTSDEQGAADGVASCAVESAARQNPRSRVLLLTSGWQLAPEVLRAFPNIEVAKLDLERVLGVDDELLAWYRARKWETGHKWHHLADVARLAILYACGGTYLDTDVISVRPLEDFAGDNMLGIEDSPPGQQDAGEKMCNAAMVFRTAGDPFVERLVREFVLSFRADSWFGWNGPQLLSRAWSAAPTSTVARAQPAVFYPLPWFKAGQMFSPALRLDEVIVGRRAAAEEAEAPRHTLAVHLWQSQVRKQLELVGKDYTKTNSFVGKLFARYCPLTYGALEAPSRPEQQAPMPLMAEITSPASGMQLEGSERSMPVTLTVTSPPNIDPEVATELMRTAVVCFELNGSPVGDCVSVSVGAINLEPYPDRGHHLLAASLCGPARGPAADRGGCHGGPAGAPLAPLAPRALSSFTVDFHSIQA